ncbi:MAG: hypothetical protein KatS3mg001_560 [Candidatus Pacearchaeota archaeon]|nr:MAG: hypothetical protein KatS3mg001_560 [Candidatus Pacearchaeota archaeon]
MRIKRKTERTENSLLYDFRYSAKDFQEYDLVYIAIDTDPRVSYRTFNDDLKISHVFFDELGEAAVKFDKEKRTVEWTTKANHIIKEIFNKMVLEQKS